MIPGFSRLAQPHHDGSPLYVLQQAPVLGDEVEVRVRVAREVGITEVFIRHVVDGEPAFREAHLLEDGDTQWWAARVPLHNPDTRYRFALHREFEGESSWYWLNAGGIDPLDVPDHSDFRLSAYSHPPLWAADAIVYQVFPDRFARSSEADRDQAPDWAIPAQWSDAVTSEGDAVAQQLYGGDLWGVADHMSHLAELGVNVLYLTPVFPARSNHRYDASSFDHVDDLLGGDEALAHLSAVAHAHGIRVMGDITTNHTGDAHEWFTRAQNDLGAPERDFYYFNGDEYESWLGVPSLPKLDYRSQELRARMWERPDSVIRRWLDEPYNLDGWRVDVANMTGRYKEIDVNHDATRELRASLEDAHPQALLIGEHVHDHSEDATGETWHGVMNYSGFTRPVWTWLSAPGRTAKFLGAPMLVPRRDGAALVAMMERFSALDPWRSRMHSFTLLGSHDTTRVRTLVGEASLVVPAAALLFTLPGIPMMTYGDEIGMEGEFGEDGRRPMPWSHTEWDMEILAAYKELIALRGEHEALRHGGLRWVGISEDVVSFVRESAGETVLVFVARDPGELVLERTELPPGKPQSLGRGDLTVIDGESLGVRAQGPGYAVLVWRN